MIRFINRCQSSTKYIVEKKKSIEIRSENSIIIHVYLCAILIMDK